MKKIVKKSFPTLLEALAAKQTLYLPQDDGTGHARYAPWRPDCVLSPALNTRRSAKDLFFPQIEDLVKFKTQGKQIQIEDNRTSVGDFVLFGVRACDCRSFDILDRVFLSEPADSRYADRRSHATVVTLACGAPEETCFCQSFGIDPAEPGGDVTCWQAGEDLFFQANTDKGRALLEGLPLEEGDEEPVAQERARIRTLLERLPLRALSTDGFGADRMLELFHHPAWETLSQSCLGCGTCTFVCPTCQCYDIREFDTGREIQRFRCWDSCMYSDFTQMSAGQPRPTQLERFRQRFLHKLVYFPANNQGIFGCVGCGRCLRQCPIHMNIVKVMKTLGGGTDAT